MNDKQWYWESLLPESIGEVFRLITAVEEADFAPIRTAWQEVETYFGESLPWKAQGARHTLTHELIAFGFVRADVIFHEDVITISGGVHPKWRRKGIGDELLERQIALANFLGKDLQLKEFTLKMYIDERQKDLADLAWARNFLPEYSFIQAQMNLEEDISTKYLGNFLQIKPLTREYYAAVFKNKSQNLAISTPQHAQNYQEDKKQLNVISENEIAKFGYEPRWCFVALDLFADRPELAGYILCSRFEFNSGVEIKQEGYIEEVVVFPKWIDKGVEEALIVHALQEFKIAGIKIAGVDLIQKADGTEKEINQKFLAVGFKTKAKTLVVSSKISK